MKFKNVIYGVLIVLLVSLMIGSFVVDVGAVGPYRSVTSQIYTLDHVRAGYGVTVVKDTLTGVAADLDTMLFDLEANIDGKIYTAESFAIEWDVTDVSSGEDINYYLDLSMDGVVWLSDATLDTLGGSTAVADEIDITDNSSNHYRKARLRYAMITNGADTDSLAVSVKRTLFITAP